MLYTPIWIYLNFWRRGIVYRSLVESDTVLHKQWTDKKKMM